MTVHEIYRLIVAMEQLRMSSDDVEVFVRARLEEISLDGLEMEGCVCEG